MADLYKASQGQSNQEIQTNPHWIFINGMAIAYSDSNDAPLVSDDTPSNAIHLRIRSNGDIVAWDGTAWDIVGHDSILADANAYADSKSVSDRAYTDSVSVGDRAYTDTKVAAVPTAFRGSLAIADAAPTLDGLYFFSQSGTYTNFGSPNKVVDLTQGLVYGTKVGSVFTAPIVIPINLAAYTLKADYNKKNDILLGDSMNAEVSNFVLDVQFRYASGIPFASADVLHFYQIARNIVAGANRQWIVSVGVNATTTAQRIAQYSILNLVEPTADAKGNKIQTIQLDPLNSSGVTIIMRVNWGALTDNSVKTYNTASAGSSSWANATISFNAANKTIKEEEIAVNIQNDLKFNEFYPTQFSILNSNSEFNKYSVLNSAGTLSGMWSSKVNTKLSLNSTNQSVVLTIPSTSTNDGLSLLNYLTSTDQGQYFIVEFEALTVSGDAAYTIAINNAGSETDTQAAFTLTSSFVKYSFLLKCGTSSNNWITLVRPNANASVSEFRNMTIKRYDVVANSFGKKVGILDAGSLLDTNTIITKGFAGKWKARTAAVATKTTDGVKLTVTTVGNDGLIIVAPVATTEFGKSYRLKITARVNSGVSTWAFSMNDNGGQNTILLNLSSDYKEYTAIIPYGTNVANQILLYRATTFTASEIEIKSITVEPFSVVLDSQRSVGMSSLSREIKQNDVEQYTHDSQIKLVPYSGGLARVVIYMYMDIVTGPEFSDNMYCKMRIFDNETNALLSDQVIAQGGMTSGSITLPNSWCAIPRMIFKPDGSLRIGFCASNGTYYFRDLTLGTWTLSNLSVFQFKISGGATVDLTSANIRQHIINATGIDVLTIPGDSTLGPIGDVMPFIARTDSVQFVGGFYYTTLEGMFRLNGVTPTFNKSMIDDGVAMPLRSADGITWEALNPLPINTVIYYNNDYTETSITNLNGTWYAISRGNIQGYGIRTSTDLTTWTGVQYRLLPNGIDKQGARHSVSVVDVPFYGASGTPVRTMYIAYSLYSDTGVSNTRSTIRICSTTDMITFKDVAIMTKQELIYYPSIVNWFGVIHMVYTTFFNSDTSTRNYAIMYTKISGVL